MTLHEICEQARHTMCSGCGAHAEQPCACGAIGVHYARVARARRLDWIGPADFAQAIHDADVFTGTTVLLDPGVAA
jgi:hypothetical protein